MHAWILIGAGVGLQAAVGVRVHLAVEVEVDAVAEAEAEKLVHGGGIIQFPLEISSVSVTHIDTLI